MSDKKLLPYADIKYKVRTYTDENGKEKGVWAKIGTLFSTPHGSNMTIRIESIPVGNEWNGWLAVYKREDATQQIGESSQATDQDVTL